SVHELRSVVMTSNRGVLSLAVEARPARRTVLTALCASALLVCATADAQRSGGPFAEMATRALAEPFVGLTVDGTPEQDLYEIAATGVSTVPVRQAAELFLDSLSGEQR